MTIIETSILSIMAILYPNDLSKMLGLIEGAGGVGIGLGPFLGSLIFYMAGFAWVFAI